MSARYAEAFIKAREFDLTDEQFIDRHIRALISMARDGLAAGEHEVLVRITMSPMTPKDMELLALSAWNKLEPA